LFSSVLVSAEALPVHSMTISQHHINQIINANDYNQVNIYVAIVIHVMAQPLQKFTLFLWKRVTFS